MTDEEKMSLIVEAMYGEGEYAVQVDAPESPVFAFKILEWLAKRGLFPSLNCCADGRWYLDYAGEHRVIYAATAPRAVFEGAAEYFRQLKEKSDV